MVKRQQRWRGEPVFVGAEGGWRGPGRRGRGSRRGCWCRKSREGEGLEVSSITRTLLGSIILLLHRDLLQDSTKTKTAVSSRLASSSCSPPAFLSIGVAGCITMSAQGTAGDGDPQKDANWQPRRKENAPYLFQSKNSFDSSTS